MLPAGSLRHTLQPQAVRFSTTTLQLDMGLQNLMDGRERREVDGSTRQMCKKLEVDDLVMLSPTSRARRMACLRWEACVTITTALSAIKGRRRQNVASVA